MFINRIYSDFPSSNSVLTSCENSVLSQTLDIIGSSSLTAERQPVALKEWVQLPPIALSVQQNINLQISLDLNELKISAESLKTQGGSN